ncbi:MAG: phosphatidylserine decarboxylase [Pirellulales bacterium]
MSRLAVDSTLDSASSSTTLRDARTAAREHAGHAARRRQVLRVGVGVGPVAPPRAEDVAPGYVKRMAERMQGTADGALHELLDPRDLKYCRNLCTADWVPEDDRFRWRSHLGFARWGLCELMLMAGPLSALTVGAACLPWPWSWTAIVPGVLTALIVWFFRDPPRRVPIEAGLIVAPADGKVVEITPLAHHEFVGGPAVRIGIFLSIFNVHINRAPVKLRVIKLHYSPGKFLNALDPESALLNENLWIGLEEEAAPHRKMVVRQISGLIARRIVCDVRPGETLECGQKFGMIKLGSRTELILPSEGLELLCRPGQNISAGSSLMAKYNT